jgi:ligand-binding SRPBCC domain-containing protein
MGTKTYEFRRCQIVGGSLHDVFAFFKNPANLEAMTPPWLQFRVVGNTDAEVRAGTCIRYKLRLHGVRFNWESRITEYVENQHFADEQLIGPYRRWYHRHLFKAVPDGVEIRDVVEYQLPLGVFGRLGQRLMVNRQLQAIFDYRARVMAERFPAITASVR